MVIVALSSSLPGRGNLFSSLPSTPPPHDPTSASAATPQPPIPIPKYPPPRKSQNPPPPGPPRNPGLKYHRHSKYYKPVKQGGPITSDGERSVIIGESGVSYHLPGAPFEFQYSYSETPRVKPLAIREPAFLPFAPPTMPRPWTGKAPLKKSKKEKAGGKIIHRVGGVVYLFRGRNYNYRTRPQYPVMLWKPAAPVYPKLIQDAPGGLTKAEADELRMKGKNLLPICKLAKNGVYITLVKDVRDGFEGSPLVKIDCKGLDPSDYKKLGAKLKDLVPCLLLSFDDEQILMWRGKDWKSRYPQAPPVITPSKAGITTNLDNTGEGDDNQSKHNGNMVNTSPKMLSLWKSAIESSKALLLEEFDLGPDALLEKVEEFENISQATEHSHPAFTLSGEVGAEGSIANFEDGTEDSYSSDGLPTEEEMDDVDDYDNYHDYDDDDLYDSVDTSAQPGSLPVDLIVEKLKIRQEG